MYFIRIIYYSIFITGLLLLFACDSNTDDNPEPGTSPDPELIRINDIFKTIAQNIRVANRNVDAADLTASVEVDDRVDIEQICSGLLYSHRNAIQTEISSEGNMLEFRIVESRDQLPAVGLKSYRIAFRRAEVDRYDIAADNFSIYLQVGGGCSSSEDEEKAAAGDFGEISFSGGAGSEANPYQIADVCQLQAMAASANLDKHFILMNDIDAEISQLWGENITHLRSTEDLCDPTQGTGRARVCRRGFQPIGEYSDDNSRAFKGTLDGNEKTISKLRLRPMEDARSARRFNYIGLFGFVYGGGLGGATQQIHDLTLSDIDIQLYRGRYVGGLMGRARASRLDNITVDGNIAEFPDGSVSFVGGIAGELTGESLLTKSTSMMNISTLGSGVGGIAGSLSQSTVRESTYTNGGSITLFGGNEVGGAVGLARRDSRLEEITVRLVDVSNDGIRLGGLVGWLLESTIENSSVEILEGGSLSSDRSQVGGLVGYASSCTRCIGEPDTNRTIIRTSSVVLGARARISGQEELNRGLGLTNGIGGAVGVMLGARPFLDRVSVRVTTSAEATLDGPRNVGGLVGSMRGTINFRGDESGEGGVIMNSFSSVPILARTVQGHGANAAFPLNIGGLLGFFTNGTLSRSYFSGSISRGTHPSTGLDTNVDRQGAVVGNLSSPPLEASDISSVYWDSTKVSGMATGIGPLNSSFSGLSTTDFQCHADADFMTVTSAEMTLISGLTAGSSCEEEFIDWSLDIWKFEAGAYPVFNE